MSAHAQNVYVVKFASKYVTRKRMWGQRSILSVHIAVLKLVELRKSRTCLTKSFKETPSSSVYEAFESSDLHNTRRKQREGESLALVVKGKSLTKLNGERKRELLKSAKGKKKNTTNLDPSSSLGDLGSHE